MTRGDRIAAVAGALTGALIGVLLVTVVIPFVFGSFEASAKESPRFRMTEQSSNRVRIYTLLDTKTGECWLLYANNVASAPKEVCL